MSAQNDRLHDPATQNVVSANATNACPPAPGLLSGYWKSFLPGSCLHQLLSPSRRQTVASLDMKSHANSPTNSAVSDERDEYLGGWRSMPFIMGNELCERLANVGLSLNMISYLMTKYHIKQVTAATVLNIVSGTSSLTPLLGAFLSDAYLGRFWTILGASFFNFLGSVFLLITAISKSLKPAGSHPASPGQLAFLHAAFVFNTIATGGLRPCTYAFGADQFRQRNIEEKKQMQSFFNWYFFFLYMSFLLGATVLVYLQDNVGWALGFGIPAIAILIAIIIFLLGNPLYRHVPPEGSPFTGFAQVIAASFHKRNLPLPADPDELHEAHEGPSESKLSHTPEFRCLDRAAIKTSDCVNEDGKVRNPWRLSTVNQVEELKALIRLGPIWFLNLLSATALSGHSAFTIPQAKTMDRHLSRSFEIPPASISVFSSITLILWVPFYDRVVVPAARRYTGNHRGIKLLQRVGIGLLISVVALIVSGIVESKRRSVARETGFIDKPKTPTHFSVFWLVPQFCLHGLGESFHFIGQLEFLFDQLPENMRSMAGAVFWCSSGIGHYTGTIILQVVHKVTGSHGRTDWLADNLNHGHLDYFYFLLAGLQFVNFFLFLMVSRWYTYKKESPVEQPQPQHELVNMASSTDPNVAGTNV